MSLDGGPNEHSPRNVWMGAVALVLGTITLGWLLIEICGPIYI